MLRDRFICGMHHVDILAALLKEDATKLNFALATEKAMSMVAALDSAGAFQKVSSGQQGTVDAIAARRQKHKGPWSSGPPSATPSRRCYCCNSTAHLKSDCPFRERDCYSCGQRGHLASVCKAAGSSRGQGQGATRGQGRHLRGQRHRHGQLWKQSKTRAEGLTGAVSMNSDFSHEEQVDLVSVIDDSLPRPYSIELELDGQGVSFAVDTGSCSTLMSEAVWKKLGKPRLHPDSRQLRSYTGHSVPVLGLTKVKVNHNGQKCILAARVVKGTAASANLMGRDWLQTLKLNWSELVGHVSSVEKTTDTLMGKSKEEFQKLLADYSAIFSEDLGCCKGFEAEVHLKEHAVPKFFKPRPLPFALKAPVGKELDRMEHRGVIEKVPFSKWAAPIVPVIKPTGAIRLCGDFKVTVNPHMEVEQHPLPRVDELFAALAGGEKFTKVDFSEAYLQVPLSAASQESLVINTHQGLYKFKRLPFGISSAPAIYQKVMDQMVQGLPGVTTYLDDILVTGHNDAEHLANLRGLFRCIKERGFIVNLKKCRFFAPAVEYLGHLIDKHGIKPLEKKLKAVTELPVPQNQSQLRSFLGAVNFYGKFIPNMADRMSTLNRLLRKDVPWKWGNGEQRAFKQLKKCLSSVDLLVHYDPRLPLGLACDASSMGLGAVLFHIMSDGSERPIAYASKTLSAAEHNYPQIEREALSLVYGVKKFHQYLWGRKFELVTDHKPLVMIFHEHKALPVMAARRIQRWAYILMGYDYSIRFRPTEKHGNADCFSRLPLGPDPRFDREEMTSEIVGQLEEDGNPITAREIAAASRRDPILSKVIHMVQSGWSEVQPEVATLKAYWSRRLELSVEDGCLLWGFRVIVPVKLRMKLLQELHSAHAGMTRMKALAQQHVWWLGMDAEIEAKAHRCQACQEVANGPAQAPLHPWELPSGPWQRLHVDYAGPFMGKMWLIVVDAYSKWPIVMPTKRTTTTATVESIRLMFASQGLPQQLVSDNGPQFTSEEFKSFCNNNGVRHVLISPYHPRSNGEAERFVQSFKRGMMKISQSGNYSQKRSLAKFLLAYRTTPHATTGRSPAEMLLGRQLCTRLDLVKPDVRLKVQDAQECQRRQDRQTKVRQFRVGELVWARNYRGKPAWVQAKVKQVLGPLAYKVVVGDNMVWKRHVDQLRSSAVPEDKPIQENPRFQPFFTAAERESTALTTPQPNEVESYHEEPQHVEVDQRAPEAPLPPRYPQRQRHPVQRYEL